MGSAGGGRRLFSSHANTRFVAGVAPLLTCQQFLAPLFRSHPGPPFAAVRECADALITDEPRYLRDRKVGLTEIVRGEIGAQLIENLTLPKQSFRIPHQVAAGIGPPPRDPLALAVRRKQSVAGPLLYAPRYDYRKNFPYKSHFSVDDCLKLIYIHSQPCSTRGVF